MITRVRPRRVGVLLEGVIFHATSKRSSSATASPIPAPCWHDAFGARGHSPHRSSRRARAPVPLTSPSEPVSQITGTPGGFAYHRISSCISCIALETELLRECARVHNAEGPRGWRQGHQIRQILTASGPLDLGREAAYARDLAGLSARARADLMSSGGEMKADHSAGR